MTYPAPETSSPRLGDACWETLLAGLAKRDVPEVVERSDGYIASAPVQRKFPILTTGRPWTDGLSVDAPHGAVLDVRAGGGRVALTLQAAGLAVVTLDTSSGATQVCHRRGLMDVFTWPVDEVPMEEKFDTFLLLGNNLGLLGSAAAVGCSGKC